MKPFRIGLLGKNASPADGGSSTLSAILNPEAIARLTEETVEIVTVPPAAWLPKRWSPRYLWRRIARCFGGEIPPVNLQPVCRRLRLDAAYFLTPAFARIDLPFIFTLWDLGHRTIPEFPEVSTARGDAWMQREALCRCMLGQASFVLVGNNAGAAEACHFFGLNREKVVALPFPNPDFSEVEEAVPAWMPTRPFFIYPAQFWPHKNHVTLLQAIARLAGSGRTAPDLVFVGADKGNLPHVKSMAAALQLEKKVHFGGFVSRGELKTLYQRAVGLVFPSLLGPNNLPPQEAAVLGCPMILSDLAGHREQLGEGALYAPALDAAAWSEAMDQLASQPQLGRLLIEKAKIAVRDNTVEAYVKKLGCLFSQMSARRKLWPS